MNIISTCLQIDAAGARITDSYGAATEVTLPLGAAVRLDFDLRGAPDPETGVLVPCDAAVIGSGVGACYFVLDRDFDQQTDPLLLRTGGIVISSGSNGSSAIFSVPIPNTGTAPLVSALEGNSSGTFLAEIGALDYEGNTIFAYQFSITVRNRLYLGGEAPESVVSDPAYCTTAEVRALIAGDVASNVALIVNSNGYVTSGEVLSTIDSGGYATSGAVAALVSSGGYATSEAVAALVSSGGYATSEAVAVLVSSGGYATSGAVAALVSSGGYATSEAVTALVSSGGYATSGAVAALIESALGSIENNLAGI